MNLLVLSQYFWPESFRINDVVQGLIERGHTVTVYTGFPNYPGGKFFPGYGWRGPYRENFHSANLRRSPLIPRGKGGSLRLALNYISHAACSTLLAPWQASGSYDAILVYEPSPVTIGIPARVLKRMKKTPIAFWVQDLWPQSLTATGSMRNRLILEAIDRLVRWIYAGCDRVLVQSLAFVDPLVAQGVSRERIAYLPNSAERFYRRIPRSGEAAPAREFPPGFRVLFAGNLGASQDLPTIIAAAELLRSHPNIRWIIVGDGRMRPWIEAEVRARSLQEHVYLLGSRPPEAMPSYFSHADLLLATLRREPIFAYTIPSKIQSYLACGKPIVAALEGEGARIILEAGAGWTVPPEDPKALAEAVLFASRLTNNELDTMGERGEVYFRDHFERELLLSRLEFLLAETSKVPA